MLHEALRSYRRITVRLINYRSDKTPFVNDLTIVPLVEGDATDPPSFAPEGFCLAEAELFDFGLQLCAAGFELRSRFQEGLAPLPVTNAHRLDPVMAQKPCQTRSQQGS